MASATEQLMMRIGLIDAATRPLQGIKRELAQVKQVAGAGFAQLAGGGAAIATGAMAIQAALGPAIEMDRALGEVASLGVAQAGLQHLGEEALRFSVEYGKSATEFVRASYDIQSAIDGLSGDGLASATRASATLAAATKSDVGTITNYTGTMYGIFKKQANEMGKAQWLDDLAGKTAVAVQMFKTTGGGMAQAFEGIGATAMTHGIALDEQLAVLGTLQNTMGAANAGSGYKSLLESVSGGGKKLELDFYGADQQLLPIVDILGKIKGKFGDVVDSKEIAQIQDAFGATATPIVLALLNKTDDLAESINRLGKTKGLSEAEKMAAAMTDQWERVGSAWFAIRAALFSAVLPSINKVVGVFADGAGVVLRWTRIFPNLTKLVAYAALAIAGLGIVIGTWMLVAGVAKLATLGLGIAWAIMISPLGMIVAGIIALIAAVAVGISYWDKIKATLADIGVFDALRTAFDTLLTPWRGLIALIKMALDASNKFLGSNFDTSWMDVNVLPEWASAPENIEPPTSVVNSPLATYRQGGQSRIPAGGLGQQLIQANAAATTANQKPPKYLSIGEVHNNFQNPLSPGELEQELWMTTRG